MYHVDNWEHVQDRKEPVKLAVQFVVLEFPIRYEISCFFWQEICFILLVGEEYRELEELFDEYHEDYVEQAPVLDYNRHVRLGLLWKQM